MDGQGVKDGLITLDQDLIKHHVVVRMGQPQQAGKVKKARLRSPVE
jgi:hypothetical protein